MSVAAPPLDPQIAFALLAAGRSQRFDGGKLQAMLGDRPLWRWAADRAQAAGFTTRFLICPDPTSSYAEAEGEGWRVVGNDHAHLGIGSSIALACSLVTTCRRLVIALADMPFVEADHLRALATAEGITFTRYASGREGVPAGFPHTAFAKLASLQGDQGAASLDWGAGREGIAPAYPDSLIDIDTPLDLERARSFLTRLRRP